MKLSIPKIEIVRIEYSKLNIVPKQYSRYLSDLNSACASAKTDFFHGREKEVNRIFNFLLKVQNSNVMLLGDNGVGKSAIIQMAVNSILKKKCPKELKNYHFIQLDLSLITAELSAETKHKNILNVFDYLMETSNIIIVVDQVHLFATSPILLYYFTLLLQLPHVKIIGLTTEDDFYNYFSINRKVISLVDIIPINEPNNKKIYPMIGEYIDILGNNYGVSISEDVVNYTVSVSGAFASAKGNPGLTVNLIENAMVVAKRRKHKEVTRSDVNYNFNFDYELYNKMSYSDKKTTAYHEAGHFLVSRLSENIKNFKTTAISIVPSEYSLGFTMFEFEPEKQTSCDADYFIDNIAGDLAGRTAETILQGNGRKSKLTSGASKDLENATSTARAIITKYGMIESCGQNMTYFCNYDLFDIALLSEERKKLIDSETKKLIDEAYKRAEKILTENRNLLDLIAQELLINDVLDEKDLDKLCSHVNVTK